jgi:uroporphyrinogen III methyltransferase/synthase
MELGSEQLVDKGHVGDAALSGRTVVITRQESQSEEMIASLEGAGAKVICCPAIETLPPENWTQLDNAIASLDRYDWVVFTSANGVRFFLERLSHSGRDVSSVSGMICVAIGPGTAAALSARDVQVDLVADDSIAEGALDAIVKRAGGEDKLRGQRFLIPRAAVARDLLPAELTRLGAKVDAVAAYRTVRPDTHVAEVVRLFEEGKIDAVTFTSSSTVANFADMIGLERFPDLLRDSLVACIGPVTAQTAESRGLKNIAQPAKHTTAALVEMLVEVLAHRLANKVLVTEDQHQA